LNALRIDSGNQNILRDLSALQVQVTTNFDRLAPLIIITYLFQLGLENLHPKPFVLLRRNQQCQVSEERICQLETLFETSRCVVLGRLCSKYAVKVSFESADACIDIHRNEVLVTKFRLDKIQEERKLHLSLTILQECNNH
jgi:hypothetical protein